MLQSYLESYEDFMATRLSAKGQLIIPREIRERLASFLLSGTPVVTVA